MVFDAFTQVAPIEEPTIAEFSGRVPASVAQAWREHGAGFVGDGYFRFVDPGQAQKMLTGSSPVPAEAVVLFTTAMADVVAWWNEMYLVAKTRLGEIHATSEPFESLVSLMDDKPGYRDVIWDWQPYPAVRDRLGVPDFEDCFMHVPLLGLGGRGDPAQMQVGSVWMHISLMVGLTGVPKFTHMLPLPAQE